jgi:hypothetical protein
MPPRREHPLPDLSISLEALPPPEKRTSRLTLSFTQAEAAMIERTAKERGEQPAVLCRLIVLTAFGNAAAKAKAEPSAGGAGIILDLEAGS